MPNLDECKGPDGQTDWNKWNELREKERKEKKDKGEICHQCGRFILFAKGYPQTCDDCKAVDRPAELDHPSEVRCPKCGYHWRVGDGDDYDLYEDGTHEVSCPDCNFDFEVETSVTYSFRSPARTKEESDEKEGEAEEE